MDFSKWEKSMVKSRTLYSWGNEATVAPRNKEIKDGAYKLKIFLPRCVIIQEL